MSYHYRTLAERKEIRKNLLYGRSVLDHGVSNARQLFDPERNGNLRIDKL